MNKLVRVRRLLSRLEFLSELPERLADLIQQERYRDAVTLYSKTIRVLTAHQHVLSFKNIKERTESMMRDLRVRVMDLLDDPQLEGVKVTGTRLINVMIETAKPTFCCVTTCRLRIS